MSKNFAVVFPGQGSQHVGMIAELTTEYPEVVKTFSQASEVLHYDLLNLVLHGPSEKLNQTVYTQPALLVASISIWNIFTNLTNKLPKVLARHSLGEYTALVASNSLNFLDAVKLVAARGQYMQEAVQASQNTDGAMAAILGIDDNQVIQNILDNINNVEIANLNAIGQTVIAGKKDSVLIAIDQLKRAGAKLAKLLDVSVPSHCSLMQPAADELQDTLNTIKLQIPSIPVIHNCSVESYKTVEQIREALIKQLTSPVRWVETIQAINRLDIFDICEFGPGNVLSKLCKRINADITAHAINDPVSLREILL